MPVYYNDDDDGHNDVVQHLAEYREGGRDFLLHSEDGHLDLPRANQGGMIGGLFVAIYGLARIAGEQFREPDAHIGFLAGGMTMGTLLSLPMVIAGLIAIVRAYRLPSHS